MAKLSVALHFEHRNPTGVRISDFFANMAQPEFWWTWDAIFLFVVSCGWRSIEEISAVGVRFRRFSVFGAPRNGACLFKPVKLPCCLCCGTDECLASGGPSIFDGCRREAFKSLKNLKV